jgi:DNA-binding SARP family transcriptional activator
VTDLSTAFLDRRELLPGWHEDWVLAERERLRSMRLHALEALVNHLRCRGRFSAAIDVALDLIRMEPLRESAHRSLISVYLDEGNVAEAIRQFRNFCRLLDVELGVGPSALLTSLLAPHFARKNTRWIPGDDDQVTQRLIQRRP